MCQCVSVSPHRSRVPYKQNYLHVQLGVLHQRCGLVNSQSVQRRRRRILIILKGFTSQFLIFWYSESIQGCIVPLKGTGRDENYHFIQKSFFQEKIHPCIRHKDSTNSGSKHSEFPFFMFSFFSIGFFKSWKFSEIG